jgi:hypothetical protein
MYAGVNSADDQQEGFISMVWFISMLCRACRRRHAQTQQAACAADEDLRGSISQLCVVGGSLLLLQQTLLSDFCRKRDSGNALCSAAPASTAS